MSRPKNFTYRYEHLESQQNHNVFIEEYFSGPDTRIFFDGEEMFEISNLSFTVQEQLKPIYGYASRTFDDVAVGSRVILGQFTVPLGNNTQNNFVAETFNGIDPNPSREYIERPSWVEDIETYTANDKKSKPVMVREAVEPVKTVTYYYAQDELPLFLAPVDGLPSVQKLQKNEAFEILQEMGRWVQIKTQRTSGYALKDTLF